MTAKFISKSNFVKLLDAMEINCVRKDSVELILDIYGDEFEKDKNTEKWHKIVENSACKTFLGSDYEPLPELY